MGIFFFLLLFIPLFHCLGTPVADVSLTWDSEKEPNPNDRKGRNGDCLGQRKSEEKKNPRFINKHPILWNLAGLKIWETEWAIKSLAICWRIIAGIYRAHWLPKHLPTYFPCSPPGCGWGACGGETLKASLSLCPGQNPQQPPPHCLQPKRPFCYQCN